MASGVKVNDKCYGAFQQVKMKTKGGKKRLFVSYKMSENNQEIVPDDEIDPEEAIKTLDELRTALPKKDCRYIIFDYSFKSREGAENSKLILVSWVPEGVPIKQKMLHASSKDALKAMVNQEIPDFQCDSPDDLTEEDILAKLRK